MSASFLPALRDHIDDGFRAGIDTSGCTFSTSDGLQPFTMLFLGSFRHLPNQEALHWFVQHVFPKIRAKEPRARLIVIGSGPAAAAFAPPSGGHRTGGLRRGCARTFGPLLARQFVCPILSTAPACA